MQLSLLNRPVRPREDERPGSPSTLPGAWRDSAISQLDALAAANDRRAATRLRTQAAVFALLGLLALAASLWWGRTERRPPPVPSATPVPSARGSVASVPSVVPSGPHDVSAPPPAKRASPDVAAAAPPPAAVASAPRAVPPKPRPTPPAAELRPRESAPPAPSAVRPLDAGAHDENPSARAPAAIPAVDAPKSDVPAGAPSAAARPDVRALCAGSAFLAAGFCHARECRKAEHQADPVCVRLRENDPLRSQGLDR